MKVSDFIEWLETQDQDAEVLVFVGRHGREWSPDVWTTEPFDTLYSEFNDYTLNLRIGEEHPCYGKKQLTLGEGL